MIDYIIKLRRPRRSILTDGWVWRMAWRDARHNFSRLFLFIASLMTGIAAIVALDSMNRSLRKDIDDNAKEIVGADLVINADKPFEQEMVALFDSTGLPQASQIDMSSMVMFLNNRQSRLVRLVALEGPFPFYGHFETQPASGYENMMAGEGALLDESLATRYAVSSDDSVKIGKSIFKVAGIVSDNPGGAGILSTFIPSVYIARSRLDSTGLIQFGSRVNYRRYLKTNSDAQTDEVFDRLRPITRRLGHGLDTVQERKEDLGEGFLSVYRFFSLLGFVALILGCIGVASSVHIYAREKREEVAVLRCVGSSGWQAFNIFFLQIFFIGVIGSFIGALIGALIQPAIPLVAKDFLPVEANLFFSWSSVGLGVVLGTVVTLLFAMLPLVAVRYVPPLSVLRTDFDASKVTSGTRVVLLILTLVFPLAFATYRTESLVTGGAFFGGLVLALACLSGVAFVILYLARRYFPSKAPFVWRHALSNLFRPSNQTQVLVITIGLGAFIIATLNVVQHSLLNQVVFKGHQNQSNTILFDIQPAQKDGVINLMHDNHLQINQVVPIVTCRISHLKGKTVSEVQADTSLHVRNWSLTREYRVTYRDTLHASERLLRGRMQRNGGPDSVFVTISEGMLDNLQVEIGDSLVFDVQGVPVKVRIGGVREVDWPQDPPNFIFVFPAGVLEQAPQTFVTATRIDDIQLASRFQQQLVMQFPNVSLIDLRLILNTINALFDKLGLVIKFLAAFSIVTGLVVLAGAVINSKFTRIRENALLRTVGARSVQITRMTLIEYAYLGLFSSLAGIILALGSGWLLSRFFFEVTFAFSPLGLAIIGLIVAMLTVLIGWYNSRGVIRTPPLQVLRKEV